MSYDPTPQRKVKAAAMIQALDVARRATDGAPLTWTHIATVLDAYSAANWRDLSVAAGRPNRTPSADTIAEVKRTVATHAAAERPLTEAEADDLFRRLG